MLALTLLLLAGCSSDKSIEQDIRYTKPAYRIDVRDLYNAYETNQEKADKKYKGQVLLVVGRASLVQEDVTGTPYAMMNASNIGSGVQCMFAPEHKKELHAATGTLYIKGRCEGFNMNVILRGCTLK